MANILVHCFFNSVHFLVHLVHFSMLSFFNALLFFTITSFISFTYIFLVH